MSVVRVSDLTFSYDTHTVGPLDFSVEQGYCVAIVGPNGSGKSTLLRMLAGVTGQTSGEASLFGVPVTDRDLRTRRRVAWVPDANPAIQDWTVREAARFQGHFYPTWSAATFDHLTDVLEIDVRARFKTLSQGQQRRALFALGAACDVDLLLADEPTTGVDPFTGGAIMSTIRDILEREDRTVVFSTHSMDEVRRYADYVLLLANGQQRAFVEKDALLDAWHIVWVSQPLGNMTPGVNEIDPDRPTRVLTDDLDTLRASLASRGVAIQRVSTPELSEVLRVLARGDPSPPLSHDDRFQALTITE